MVSYLLLIDGLKWECSGECEQGTEAAMTTIPVPVRTFLRYRTVPVVMRVHSGGARAGRCVRYIPVIYILLLL